VRIIALQCFSGVKRAFDGLLFKASAEMVMIIAADPKRTGARGNDQSAA